MNYRHFALTAAALATTGILALQGATAQTVAVPSTTAPAQSAVPAGTTIPPVPGYNHGAQAIANVDPAQTTATAGALGKDALPSVDSAGAGNVGGILYYCIKTKTLYGTTPRTVARTLSKRPDVRNDQYYALGGKGLLQTNTNAPFDIKTLDLSKRTKVCNDLVKRGQSLIGG